MNYELVGPETYKELLEGTGLYKLELEKADLTKQINDDKIEERTKNIYRQYLSKIEELIQKEVEEASKKETFKLKNIKYTQHYGTGEINNGFPKQTTVEIYLDTKTKSEGLESKYKVKIIHEYYGEKDEIKAIKKEYYLDNGEVLFDLLSSTDLRDLKNNYEAKDKFYPSYWELEYNTVYKIAGTKGQEPPQVKKILKTLNIEYMCNEALAKVKEETELLICPICGSSLKFMLPSGAPFCCVKCDKYFENNNGKVGKETTYPYTDSNADY